MSRQRLLTILHAYGEARFRKARKHIDEVSGYIRFKRPRLWGEDALENEETPFGFTPADLGFSGHEAEYDDSGERWRPKALAGIETNNGWHVINSEADFPKEAGYYYFWFRDMERKERGFFDPQNRNCIDFCLVWYSHWQPELQPPLYGPDTKKKR